MTVGERWEDWAENIWHRQEQHHGGYRPREAVGCQSPASGFALQLANAAVLKLNCDARRTDGRRLQGCGFLMDVF